MIKKPTSTQIADIIKAHIPEEELPIVAAKLMTVTGRKELRILIQALANDLDPESTTQSGGDRIPTSGRMKQPTKVQS